MLVGLLYGQGPNGPNKSLEFLNSSFEKGLAEKGKVFLDRTPMKSSPQETEMAAIAVFLASDDSSAITGQVIVAAKGWSTYGGYKYE